MSQNAPASWLVTYDISNPRRLGRVFRALKKEGIPVQYSVFLVQTSQARMGAIMTRLATLIHPAEDDVRAYRVPTNTWQATLGQSILPTDVWQDPHHPFLLR